MKIGIDIRPLMEGKITGVEVYTTNLLRALFELDKSNEYLLFSNSFKQNPDAAKFRYPNVKYKNFRFPNKIFNFSLRFFHWPKIDKLLGGLDIFFSPRYLFTALSADCRLIVTVHDLSFVLNPDFFSLKGRLWHRLVSDRGAAQKAAGVIAVSESTKRDLINFFQIPPEKITIIRSGVDLKVYNPGMPEELLSRTKTAYDLSPGYILYLGTIEPRKNIEGIIEAYEILRQSKAPASEKLVLAGGLGWSYRTILKKIAASPFKSDIRLLHAVPEETKPALYKMAKILVFPSFYEGFGFPPLEASACGTPAIVGMNSSFPEVMGNACLYVNPFDSAQIASAMEALLTDGPLRADLIKKGLERVKMFSWKNTAGELLKVFGLVI